MTPFEPIDTSDQDLSPAVLAALRGCSPTRPTPPLRLFTTFENGVADVSHKHYAIGDYPDMLTNKYQLVCPRDKCRSIILREGVARLEEREAVQVSGIDFCILEIYRPVYRCNPVIWSYTL